MSSKEILNEPPIYGFVPKHLEIEGKPILNLFPFNILFVGCKYEKGCAVMGSAVYEPDLATFKEEKDVLSMKYDNLYGKSRVIIEYIKSAKYWIGTKYVNEEVAGNAVGMDWNMFFSHFTSLGLANLEPCMIEVKSTESPGGNFNPPARRND